MKGSPIYPSKQEHVGVCLITSHRVLEPHEPGQGSRHFSFMHAKLLGHSEFMTHSGRQFGGFPMKLGRQEHEGVPEISLH